MSVATSKSSGLLSVGTTVISSYKALLNSIQVNTDGTNAATVTVYNNPSAASGTVLAQLKVPGATLSQTVVFTFPLYGDLGMTVVVAGTGAQAIIGFGAS